MTRVGQRLLLAAVLAVAVGVAITHFQPDEIPRPPGTMAKPDGRVWAVIQLCWWPHEVGGVVRSSIGTVDKAEVQFKLECRHPYVRKGLVAQGDKLTLGWTMNPGSPRSVDYRITINNREARRASRDSGNGSFECVIGTRPCEVLP